MCRYSSSAPKLFTFGAIPQSPLKPARALARAAAMHPGGGSSRLPSALAALALLAASLAPAQAAAASSAALACHPIPHANIRAVPCINTSCTPLPGGPDAKVLAARMQICTRSILLM